MGSLNAVVVSEGPDVKEVLHTKVRFCQNIDFHSTWLRKQGYLGTWVCLMLRAVPSESIKYEKEKSIIFRVTTLRIGLTGFGLRKCLVGTRTTLLPSATCQTFRSAGPFISFSLKISMKNLRQQDGASWVPTPFPLQVLL